MHTSKQTCQYVENINKTIINLFMLRHTLTGAVTQRNSAFCQISIFFPFVCLRQCEMAFAVSESSYIGQTFSVLHIEKSPEKKSLL